MADDTKNLTYQLLKSLSSRLSSQTGYDVRPGTHKNQNELWDRPYIRVKPADDDVMIYRNGELVRKEIILEISGFSDSNSYEEIIDMKNEMESAMNEPLVLNNNFTVFIQTFDWIRFGSESLEEQVVNRFNSEATLQVSIH